MVASCQSYCAGDLLFHVASKGNAITDVTPGMIDHVAIVVSRDSVIEAVGSGVMMTPIDSLRQQDGYYLIGKVIRADRKQSIRQARQYLGRAYDHLLKKEWDRVQIGSFESNKPPYKRYVYTRKKMKD